MSGQAYFSDSIINIPSPFWIFFPVGNDWINRHHGCLAMSDTVTCRNDTSGSHFGHRSYVSMLFCSCFNFFYNIFGYNSPNNTRWHSGSGGCRVNLCSIFTFHGFRHGMRWCECNSGSINIVVQRWFIVRWPIRCIPFFVGFWCIVGIHFHHTVWSWSILCRPAGGWFQSVRVSR